MATLAVGRQSQGRGDSGGPFLGWDGRDIVPTECGGSSHLTATPDYVWTVALSGGILTSAFFLPAFWVWARFSATLNDTDLEVAAFFAAGIGNLVYAPTELIMASQAEAVAASVVGFAVAAAVCFFRLSRRRFDILKVLSHSAPHTKSPRLIGGFCPAHQKPPINRGFSHLP